MAYTRYTTVQGDRWDTVAFKAYGDATLYSEIVEANPTVPKDAVIPSGIVLNIPIRENSVSKKSVLPPWKQ